MTTSERCRAIARALDNGDLSVLTEHETFIARHRGEIWDLRAAQQNKAQSRNMPTVAGTRTIAHTRVTESRTMRATAPPDPDDDDDRDRDEVLDQDQECECPCPECREGDCSRCSDPNCDDLGCVHGEEEADAGEDEDHESEKRRRDDEDDED